MCNHNAIRFIVLKNFIGTNGQFFPDFNCHILAAHGCNLLTGDIGNFFYCRYGTDQIINRNFSGCITGPVSRCAGSGNSSSCC